MSDLRKEEMLRELRADGVRQQEHLQTLLDKAEQGRTDYGRAQMFMTRWHPVVKSKIKDVVSVRARGTHGSDMVLIRNLDIDRCAFLLMDTALSRCLPAPEGVPVSVMSLAIGRDWELEANVQAAIKEDPLQWQEFEDRKLNTERHRSRKMASRILGSAGQWMTDQQKARLGSIGLAILVDAGILVMPTSVRNVARRVWVKPEYIEEITGFDNRDVSPVWHRQESRMYCPPDPYTDIMDGGYLSPHRKARTPLINIAGIRKDDRERVSAVFTAKNMPEVFSAVNYLQSTAFRIHKPTRDAILRVWASGGGVLGVPTTRFREPPQYPFPPDHKRTEADEETFKNWKRSKAIWHEAHDVWRGNLREVHALLKATRDVDRDIYFPVFSDTRGRLYYRGIPNPQGTDMSKGHLHFSDKRPLGKDGLFWLKVHIANSYGFDKERMYDRAKWTEENWSAIEAALDRPEDRPDAFGDSPWCMFSAAWELREAYRSGDPESYRTGVPVGMDATCSGLQHFSAMLRDEQGGHLVNLTNGLGYGPKQDIYSYVAARTMESLERECLSEPSERRTRAEWWLRKGITRAMAKRPVMTFCYSATARSAGEHIFQCLIEDFAKTGDSWREKGEGFRDCLFLGNLLFEEVKKAFPAAAAAMQWLRELVASVGDSKVVYTSPTGFEVQQDTREQRIVRVMARSRGIDFKMLKDTNRINSRGQKNSVSPNFVHSMDSAHLVKTVNRMAERGNMMAAVHDCFYTHACSVSEMNTMLREEFVKMYSGNALLDLRNAVNPEFTEPPKQGTLDMSKVLESEFFFS